MPTTVMCIVAILWLGIVYAPLFFVLASFLFVVVVLCYAQITKNTKRSLRIYSYLIQNKLKLLIALILCSYSLSCWLSYLDLPGCRNLASLP